MDSVLLSLANAIGMSLPALLTWLDIFAAIAMHFWFKKHEPDTVAALFVPLLSTLAIITFFWASSESIHGLWKPYLIFVAAILGSITFYRLSPFHPLSHFPGPTLYKISKLSSAFAAYRGKLHEYHKQFHEKYGPIVRVGPNELSIANKEFIPLVLGSSGLPKGPLWEGRLASSSNGNIINHFDAEGHARLRKSWDKAFGIGPLNDYMTILVPNALRVKEHLDAVCKSSPDGEAHIDFAMWMTFFSLDFMGDMAFGGRFHFIRDGDKHGLVRDLGLALSVGSITQHVPWLGPLLSALLIMKDRARNFRLFALKQAKLRFVEEEEKRDLFYHLLNAADPDSTIDPFSSVSGSVLTVLAGSDTTAFVLRNIMYYLLAYPGYFQMLREEIDENFPFEHNTPIEFSKLSSMKVLNGIINEALRTLPALSTSIQRATFCRGGKVMANVFIPEGTGITIPPYTLHRDPRYFSPRSNDFWPERWLISNTEEKNFVLDRAAFIPFSYGPGNCVGKSLAIIELRYIITMLVQQFDITLEQGFEMDLQRNTGDRFTLSPGSLPVIVTVRQ